MTDFLDRVGHCYELAAQHVVDNGKNWYLVHGTIQGAGYPPIDHAWTKQAQRGPDEYNWTVPTRFYIYDAVLDKKYSEAEYKEFANYKEQTVYSYEEVLFHLLEFRHYGPWSADNSSRHNKGRQ